MDVLNKLVEVLGTALCLANDLRRQSVRDLSFQTPGECLTVPSSAFLTNPVRLRPLAFPVVHALKTPSVQLR